MMFSRYKFDGLPAMQKFCSCVVESQPCTVSFRGSVERELCRNVSLADGSLATASLPMNLHSSCRRNPRWHRIR